MFLQQIDHNIKRLLSLSADVLVETTLQVSYKPEVKISNFIDL